VGASPAVWMRGKTWQYPGQSLGELSGFPWCTERCLGVLKVSLGVLVISVGALSGLPWVYLTGHVVDAGVRGCGGGGVVCARGGGGGVAGHAHAGPAPAEEHRQEPL
jgi:hypothetical protein